MLTIFNEVINEVINEVSNEVSYEVINEVSRLQAQFARPPTVLHHCCALWGIMETEKKMGALMSLGWGIFC